MIASASKPASHDVAPPLFAGLVEQWQPPPAMKRSTPSMGVPASLPASAGVPVSGDVASGGGPPSVEGEPSWGPTSGVPASDASVPASLASPLSIAPSVEPSAPASVDPSTPPSVGGLASQRPMASVIDEQSCSVGQPLPPVPRQPGTQREVVASHTRPDVVPPQSASTAQPQ